MGGTGIAGRLCVDSGRVVVRGCQQSTLLVSCDALVVAAFCVGKAAARLGSA